MRRIKSTEPDRVNVQADPRFSLGALFILLVL